MTFALLAPRRNRFALARSSRARSGLDAKATHVTFTAPGFAGSFASVAPQPMSRWSQWAPTQRTFNGRFGPELGSSRSITLFRREYGSSRGSARRYSGHAV